jgi:hypothetical protein
MKLKIQIWLLIATFIASLFSSTELKVHFLNADVFQFQVKTSIQIKPFRHIEETIEEEISIKKKVKQLIGHSNFNTLSSTCISVCSLFLVNDCTYSYFLAFDTSPPCFSYVNI